MAGRASNLGDEQRRFTRAKRRFVVGGWVAMTHAFRLNFVTRLGYALRRTLETDGEKRNDQESDL